VSSCRRRCCCGQPDGRILARTSDLVRWRFVLPEVTPVARNGETYLALDTLPGLRFRIDPATQTLHIGGEAVKRRFLTLCVGMGLLAVSTHAGAAQEKCTVATAAFPRGRTCAPEATPTRSSSRSSSDSGRRL